MGFLAPVSILLLALSALAEPGTGWNDEWMSGDGMDSGLLQITNATEAGFDFAFTVTSGANVGELNGKALLAKDAKKAMGKVENCQVEFTLDATKLSVTTDRCDSFAPAGVSFDGDYRSGKQAQRFEAGFDCQRATSSIEKTICQSRWLANADKELAELFKNALAKNSAGAKQVKTTQRAWLGRRNATCETSADLANCIADQYLTRLHELLGASKNRKASITKRLAHADYVKSSYDESRDALWNDPTVRLLVFRHLGEETTEFFFGHNLYFSEADPKWGKSPGDIVIRSRIRGLAKEAATVLTRDGELWIAFSTANAARWEPHVYGPKGGKPTPVAIKNWLAESRGPDWLPPVIKPVF